MFWRITHDTLKWIWPATFALMVAIVGTCVGASQVWPEAKRTTEANYQRAMLVLSNPIFWILAFVVFVMWLAAFIWSGHKALSARPTVPLPNPERSSADYTREAPAREQADAIVRAVHSRTVSETDQAETIRAAGRVWAKYDLLNEGLAEGRAAGGSEASRKNELAAKPKRQRSKRPAFDFAGWDLIDPIELWRAAYLCAETPPPESSPQDVPDNVVPWLLKLRQAVVAGDLLTDPSLEELKERKRAIETMGGTIATASSLAESFLGALGVSPARTSGFPTGNVPMSAHATRGDLATLAGKWGVRPKFLFKDAR